MGGVILSAAKDLRLSDERSFAALRMTASGNRRVSKNPTSERHPPYPTHCPYRMPGTPAYPSLPHPLLPHPYGHIRAFLQTYCCKVSLSPQGFVESRRKRMHWQSDMATARVATT